MDGFLSIAPSSRVTAAESWLAEEAVDAAARIARQRFDGVFCCNDRLAEALISACRAANLPLPAIVGFDDAPMPEQLDLTTVAIP